MGLIGTSEAARVLGIAPKTARRLALRGDLPALRLGRRGRYRFSVEALEELLSSASRGSGVDLARGVTGRAEPLVGGAGCTAGATKMLVRRFVADYNGGRVAAADRVWAPAPRFQWFSTIRPGARLGPPAFNRATLAAYFRTRVRVHERIRLTKLGAGYDANRHLVHFRRKLVRSADDLRPTPHDFKGAADCESGHPSLIVWSM